MNVKTRIMGLKEEIKQNKPFLSLKQVAVLSIARTASVIDRAPAKMFKAAGITGPQYNVLRILRGSPQGLCRNEIGTRMIVNVPDVTRLLDRMEASGLVTRQRTTEDRRFVMTKITDKGKKLAEDLEPTLRDELGGKLEAIADQELQELINVLDKIRHALQD